MTKVKTKTCTVRVLERGPKDATDCTVSIEADYDAEFIKRLKYIPTDCRAYDPDTHYWFVRPEYLERVKDFAIESDFDEIIFVDGLTTDFLRRDTSQPGLF